MQAIIVFNGKNRFCIPIPNVKIEDVDVKIIKDIMNWDGGSDKEKLSVVYSFLRYLKRKQAK